MSKGPRVGVGTFLLLLGTSAAASAEPARAPRFAESTLRAAGHAALSARALGAGLERSLLFDGSAARPAGSAPARTAVVQRGAPSAARSLAGGGGSPGAPAWMPGSTLPRQGVGAIGAMDRASSVLDRLRRRVFGRLLGARGARVGFYVGRNLAKGDVSGVRTGGLKYEL